MKIRSFLFAIISILLTTASFAQSFPLTIEHKFGTTTIEQQPERVASVDYSGVDNLLALGVQPVAIRYWFGENDGVWPWAESYQKSEPVVLRGALDFEQIAATKPDVIIAISSGISSEEYEKLSKIAPTVAVAPGIGDFAMPWDARALMTGKIVGKEKEAQAQVDAIKEKFKAAADANPHWQGKSLAIAFFYDGSPGAFTSIDTRSQVLAEFGFVVPKNIDELAGDGQFWTAFSEEQIEYLNTDLLVWTYSGEEGLKTIQDWKGRAFLPPAKEGRELFLGDGPRAAFSYGSLLSLDHLIDELVPMLEAATDGDPSTNKDNR
jgi:iron complex transport system substrate-binding protein